MIVIDASVIADALIDDGPAGTAARTALTADQHWAAPAHLGVEVISAIRGKLLGRKIRPARAHDAIEALPGLVIDEIPIGRLVDRIWQLRGNLRAYDAAYVAAAEGLDCPLLTGDGRLATVSGLRCEVRVVPAG